jgi:prephenate dehydratase
MAKPQRVTYFKTNLEDKPGALLAVARELKSKNLDLVGLWGFTTTPGQSELYVVAKNPEKLRKAWTGRGYQESIGFYVKGTDKTGALVKSLEAILQGGINMSTLGAVAVRGNYGCLIWVKQEDVEKAAKVLGAK